MGEGGVSEFISPDLPSQGVWDFNLQLPGRAEKKNHRR